MDRWMDGGMVGLICGFWPSGSDLLDLAFGIWSLGSGLWDLVSLITSIHPKAGAALELLQFRVPAVVRISEMEALMVDPDGSPRAEVLSLQQPRVLLKLFT